MVSVLLNGQRNFLRVSLRMTEVGFGREQTRVVEVHALSGLQEPSGDPRPPEGQQPPEPPSATEWRDPSIMGTPASIACDLPQHEAPETCTRKRASANIFQGVGLLQLCRLFHSSGDEQAEERAQLVWECAGKQSIAQALQQLHKRQRKLRLRSRLRPHSEMNGGTRLPELQHFSRLRIEDCTTPCAGGDGCINNDKQIDAAEQTTHYTASHYRKKKSGMGTAGYLHQLHR
ncbi:arginine vasopressin-induced protein 1 isoform X1 [Rhineura floridana]|uniref:arginine vasopressin-induced protein 1 isoform X1 n=1 Tax=Rhineura floridana TaxID=261503 RepID=UPI002AC8219A|nr:arginine vasopressin-induced protein 1 isoform X1 [Rhineura floridana]